MTVAIALLTAGCGGGADKAEPTGTTSPALTDKQVFERAEPSVVALHGKQRDSDNVGTGVIFDAQKGLILTNAHVVAGLSSLKVRVGNGPEVPARIVGTAPCDDVAVVEFVNVPPDLVAAKLGDSKAVKHQDSVVALGYPLGLRGGSIATQKIVSTNGAVQSPNVAASPDPSLPRYPATIQHSATINPGNSGGPLLNDRAEVIGINTLANQGTESAPVQGQYYAISIDHIELLLPDLIAGKSPTNVGWDMLPFSQVALADLFEATGYGTRALGREADDLLQQAGIDGLVVVGVDAGSPADKGRIELGDLVTHLKGTPVRNIPEVCDVLQSATPGQSLGVKGRYLTNEGDDTDFGDEWTSTVELRPR